MADVSEEARAFIDRYIDSLEKLEVLMLLARSPERAFSAGEVASTLQIGLAAADRNLGQLTGRSLLEAKLGKDLFYTYAPRLPHLEKGARALEREYRQNRLAVLKLVAGHRPGSLRDFAEAFRITRKKDDSDG